MKISSFRLLALFAVVLATGVGYGQTAAGDVRLAGLRDSVKVSRDGRHIPYIEAKNDADLYFVQGYVTASDRLWQMDLLRRVARGETAEIFGKTTLEEDKRWRRFGFARVADESLKYLETDLLTALENYTRGVNAYIATLDKETLPVEFRILQYQPREWTPADTVIIGKILADALSNTYHGDLIRETLKDFDPDKLADLNQKVTPYDVILFGKDAAAEKNVSIGSDGRISPTKSQDRNLNSDKFLTRGHYLNEISVLSVAKHDMELRERSLRRVGLYAEELAASNNWVISGKRTADGKPILANDPHLMAAAPGIWYMSHLSTPGMRVAGVTFPGVPGIVLGHNEHIAWGATNVGPDVQDLYLITLNDKGEYKTPGGWTATKVRKEEIRFRQNPLSPQLTSDTLEVTETAHGPVIVERGDRKYALRWTALDPQNPEFNAFFRLNRARDWNGFKKALSAYGGPMQNFVYADTSGKIGWYAASRIPIRRKGDGSLPYDGATADGDWTGFIPFDDLPHLFDPPSGLIVTANQRIVGTDYKHQQLVRDFASPWRARRLYDLLSAEKKATMDSVSAAQHDVYNIPLAMLAKEIVAMKAASDDDLKIISEWDGRMTPDSRAALLVNEIRMCAANKIAEAFKPAPAGFVRERILYWAVEERAARWLPKEFKDYGELLRSCNDASGAAFAKRYGEDRSKWVWGRTMTARFPHPMAAAPLIGMQFATPNTPIAGSGQTPNVASFVSMRYIASPGNWDETRLVIPLGQSGDPGSPHYKDQFDAWSMGTPSVFPFSNDAVKKAAVNQISFLPK